MRPSVYLAVLGLLFFASATCGQQTLKSPCPTAIKINTNHQFNNALHFICLQPSTPTSFYPTLQVIHYQSRQVVAALQVDDFGANQLASFVDDEGILRILLAVSDRVNGTSMYSIDRTGQSIKETHSVNTQLVSSMTVWRLGLNWEWQLAIANQPTYEMYLGPKAPRVPLPDPWPMISFYSWRSTYFDPYDLIKLPQDGHVTKLEPMNVNGQEMLVVAMEPHRGEPNYGRRSLADSHLYKLDFSDGNLRWSHYQSLNTQLALDVKPFTITHRASLLRHYFIALLGQPAKGLSDTNQVNSNNAEFGLVIYKYFGDRFVNTGFTPAPGATRLDAISYGAGDSYVVIALLSEWSNQVNLYLFDGLLVKLIPSPFPQITALQSFARPKRTMAPANIHLFAEKLATEDSPEQGNDSSVKRTLSEEVPQSPFQLPTIVISQQNATAGETTEPLSTLYSVPVDELIKADQVSADEGGYQKRTLTNTTDLVGWCQAKVAELLADGFTQKARQLQTLPRVNQNRPIEFKGDLVIDGDLSISNLLLVNRVEQQSRGQKRELVEGPVSNFSDTFNEIQSLHKEIDDIKNLVDQILVDDGSNQDVFSPIAFDNLIVECNSPILLNSLFPRAPHLDLSCPHIDQISTTWLNKRNVSRIQREALLTGRMMIIDRDVRFEHLILKGDVEIYGSLNGLPIAEIVFKRGPSMDPIRGHKNFRNGLYSSSELVVANWEGAVVNRDNYLTASGEQRIDANLRFSNVIIDPSTSLPGRNSSSRFEKLNNLNLDMHLDNIATIDGNNNFEVPLRFDELILNGNVRFTTNSRLSGVDLEDLWLHTMFKQSNQNVSAPMEFAGDVHVSYGGEVTVLGTVNNYEFSPARILMRNHNFTFYNPFIFEQDVTAQDLYVRQALNGIQVLPDYETRQPELAILYDGGTQVFSGDKLLNDVHLGGNSTISGNINGHLDLNQLYKLATNTADNHRFLTIRLSGQDIRLDDAAALSIAGTINGFSTQEICSLAMRAAQAPVTNYNRLNFEQTAHFKSIRCATINGFNNLSNFFLTRQGDQRVAGTLRLTDGLIFNTSVNIQSTLNKLNVQPLASAITRTLNETLTGHKIITGDLVIDDLIVDRINQLHLANVFLTRADLPQVVRAPMIFDHLDIENVLIVGNLQTNSFNKLNISDIMTNTLQYDAPQVIYNHVQLQTLQILPGADLITSNFNGHDLRRLYSDAVLVDVPQQILAPKTFITPVDFNNRVTFRHSIDGLTNDELRSILLLQSDELIHGDLELNNEIFVRKDLEIQSGIINDIDINTFVSNMLYENNAKTKGLRVFGNGTVRFKDVKVNNLVVAGTVQGLDLSKEAVTRQDIVNGTYNLKIAEQQKMNNNARLISSGSTLRVASNYRNKSMMGACQVHSCWSNAVKASNITTVWRPVFLPPQVVQIQQQQRPQSLSLIQSAPAPQQQQQVFVSPAPPPLTPSLSPTQQLQPQVQLQVRPQLPPLPPYQSVWPQILVQTQPPTRLTVAEPARQQLNTSLYYPEYPELRYLEYQRAQAVQELSYRVNKYLMASLFYEITQREPLLGPVLGAVESPAEKLRQLLMLKGSACGGNYQSVAIMSQTLQSFSLISSISSKDIVEPIAVRSLIVGQTHYLVTLDETNIVLHRWNSTTAMYVEHETIGVDRSPTAMKVFSYGNLGCIALANPRLFQGKPSFFCQREFQGSFQDRVFVPMNDVVDLDVLPTALSGGQIVFAALSQRPDLHIGHLTINTYDMVTNSLKVVASKTLARPLKLHFVRNPLNSLSWQIIVSEAITSNDDTEANTHVFALRLPGAQLIVQPLTVGQFYESQLLRDNQFYDIQSVMLNGAHSMLFLQSAHSISIYAPRLSLDVSGECDTQYALVQRLPTKGANKFLVFNDRPANSSYLDPKGLFSHSLVLSRDDCELQQYSNLFLRAKFK